MSSTCSKIWSNELDLEVVNLVDFLNNLEESFQNMNFFKKKKYARMKRLVLEISKFSDQRKV